MIEQAKLEDKEEIYNLICILENKEINKEHFDSVFENSLKNEDIIYLVYRDEKIEGFLSFKMHHYLHHDHDTGEIVELVILPEKRSFKIGRSGRRHLPFRLQSHINAPASCTAPPPSRRACRFYPSGG